ncbi:MAG: hypothetical protein HGB01_06940 [Chlorobiaceae bacterium]|nr:hypothetical protein [Chlorobiaceae bacterium]
MIALKRTSGPATPVVTTDEVKQYGRISNSAQDSMLSDLITSATAEVEELTNRALITQTWSYIIGGFPGVAIRLPKSPLQEVDSIRYTDHNGDLQTVDPEIYQVSTAREPGEIRLKPGCQWPTVDHTSAEPVTITYLVGYGESGLEVPQKIRQAIIALVVYWYDNGLEAAVPVGIRRALDNYQVFYEI